MDSSEEEEHDDDDDDAFVVPDHVAPVYEGPNGEDVQREAVDLTTMDENQDDETEQDGDDDDDFQPQPTSRGNNPAMRAQSMRALAQDARANDSRQNVAADDAASMREAAAAAAGSCDITPPGDPRWFPNQLRCRICSCCLRHRGPGGKGWTNKSNKSGGCCSRAPVACKHVDPKYNQDSEMLGNDDTFMDRDVDETGFDDFEEPTSEPEESEDEALKVRSSSRRQAASAQRAQKVQKAKQDLQNSQLGARSDANSGPVMRPVPSIRSGAAGMGFMRSEPNKPRPAGYRDPTSPGAAAGAARAAGTGQPQRAMHSQGRNVAAQPVRRPPVTVPKVDPNKRKWQQMQQQQMQQQQQRQQQQAFRSFSPVHSA